MFRTHCTGTWILPNSEQQPVWKRQGFPGFRTGFVCVHSVKPFFFSILMSGHSMCSSLYTFWWRESDLHSNELQCVTACWHRSRSHGVQKQNPFFVDYMCVQKLLAYIKMDWQFKIYETQTANENKGDKSKFSEGKLIWGQKRCKCCKSNPLIVLCPIFHPNPFATFSFYQSYCRWLFVVIHTQHQWCTGGGKNITKSFWIFLQWQTKHSAHIGVHFIELVEWQTQW